MKTLYTTTALATGDGRNGHTATDDGLIDLDVRIPVSMGGPGGAANPEQLFAAGYAACFHSALRLVASREKVPADDSTVKSTVSIGTLPNGGFGLAVALIAHIPGQSHEVARSLVEKAHQVCPYSNATRGNIDITLDVE